MRLKNIENQETLAFRLEEFESKAVLRTFLFGPQKQFRCIAGKRDGIPFFVVPEPFATAFELHVHNLIHNRFGKGELAEIKMPCSSGKNRFYELRKLSNFDSQS